MIINDNYTINCYYLFYLTYIFNFKLLRVIIYIKKLYLFTTFFYISIKYKIYL